MTDEQYVIELEPDDTEGQLYRAAVAPEDQDWLRDKLGREPGSRIVLRASDDDDTEGHLLRSAVTVRVASDDDDTEGHAISVHFPTKEEADAFRKRLLLAGALAGTIALGAAGGAGLANLSSDSAGAGAGTGAAAGMDWSQAERPGTAAAGAGPAAGMDWSQAERPGTAAAGGGSADSDDAEPSLGGPTPR
ncbi:MAG TPA: hypothetical protein VMP86_04945 [Candidatus Binatia bacterium]|nr:hypothetical protein [Candidatus Binatia bacterium]